MTESRAQTIWSGLTTLFETAPDLDGWNKGITQTLIDVGEYALALDEIAYVYLESGKPMSADDFQLFEKLAALMELQKDPEFEGVAKLRAQGMPR